MLDKVVGASTDFRGLVPSTPGEMDARSSLTQIRIGQGGEQIRFLLREIQRALMKARSCC
jgi:hypothetical protein